MRPARAGDLPRYGVIERAAATLYAPWGLDGVLADTATPEERISEAIERGELIAAVDAQDVMVGYALSGTDEDDLHLEELAVDPVFGRRGLGTALLDATLARGARIRARRVTLVTLDFVPFGRAFYEARGFHVLDAAALSPRLRTLAPPHERDGRVAMARAIVTG